MDIFFRYDFFQRSSLSGLTSPMTTSMHGDLQTPTYASDMRILMENMQALNVNNRQEGSLINSTSFKDKERRSMIPIRHNTLQSYNSNQSLAHSHETSDVRNIDSIINPDIYIYIYPISLLYYRDKNIL
jgi:hypothetical protein